jgi:hypothetical protein
MKAEASIHIESRDQGVEPDCPTMEKDKDVCSSASGVT